MQQPIKLNGGQKKQPTMRQNQPAGNVMTAFYEGKKIPQNIISFYFSLAPGGQNGAKAGAVVVGGVDPQFYEGSIIWHDVAEHGPEMWTLNLDSLTVGNGTNLCQGGCVGVIDTGTSLIVTDGSTADAINKQLNIGDGCENLQTAPDVNFVFSGSDHQYHLPAHAVTLKSSAPATAGGDPGGEAMCAPAIRSMDGSGSEVASDAMEIPAATQALGEQTASVDAVVPEQAAARRLLGGTGQDAQGYGQGGQPDGPPQSAKWGQISSMFGGKQVVIVGDIFLRHHYSAFDNTDSNHAKVGFAAAKGGVDLESVF